MQTINVGLPYERALPWNEGMQLTSKTESGKSEKGACCPASENLRFRCIASFPLQEVTCHSSKGKPFFTESVRGYGRASAFSVFLK